MSEIALEHWRFPGSVFTVADGKAFFYSEPALVLAHGCFDLLHVGHIRHLQEAAKLGRLVVSITSDRFVAKGAGRPHFNQDQRAEALRALGCVAEVRICDAPDAVPMIRELKPAYFVKGIDYEPNSIAFVEAEACREIGAKLHITQTEKFSSSRIINSEKYGEEVIQYLASARERGFLGRIEQAFSAIKNLKVGFVGETIVDQYVYVSPLAKPSKEFVLAAAELSEENFLGGVKAAASHLRDLCRVGVATQGSLHPLRKRRYVEQGFTRKLFETYAPARLELPYEARRIFAEGLVDVVELCDVVIVLDFGHGLMDAEAQGIVGRSKFLAINAQTNAGNHGFNLVTQYEKADYVCVDAPEARLAVGSQFGEIAEVRAELERKMGAANVVVTHGREGAYGSAGRVPALAASPVDTMGAGDCFIAITAPLIAVGLEAEAAAFVGNVAAAMKVGIVGHREPINGETLKQTVRALLQ